MANGTCALAEPPRDRTDRWSRRHSSDLGGLDQPRARVVGWPAGAAFSNPDARPGSGLSSGQHFLLNELGVHVAVDELRPIQHLQMEFHRCWDPGDGTFIQGSLHPGHGVVAVLAPNDQLADQGVVEGRNVVARVDVAVDAHTRPAGGQPSRNASGGGTEVMCFQNRI